jgi:DNA polymerase-3 subunit epsilon
MVERILNNLFKGIYFIFVSEPVKVGEEGLSAFFLVIFGIIFCFHAAVWWSAMINLGLRKGVWHRTKLNKKRYLIISIVTFIVSSFLFIAFHNLFINFLLGFILSPIIFNYGFFSKKEKFIKIFEIIGIIIGFVSGIFIAEKVIVDPGLFYFPLFSAVGSFTSCLIAYYIASGLLSMFKIYGIQEIAYNKNKQVIEQREYQRKLSIEAENKKQQLLREQELLRQTEANQERIRIQRETALILKRAEEQRQKRLDLERQLTLKRQNVVSSTIGESGSRHYLFFDTETSGLPRNYNAPASDTANWPRLVQIAYALFDENRRLIKQECLLVKPVGFTISKQAVDIHKITTEKAQREGLALSIVLGRFIEVLRQAEYLIGHNISFDENIMLAEMLRTNNQNYFQGKTKFCTMKNTTNFCKLPSLNGFGGYKWPSLVELHLKLFNTGFSNAHNAAADVDATAKCYWKLKDLSLM